jgi:23S rRNA (pseudouridine1915-N3)-methyltransferase
MTRMKIVLLQTGKTTERYISQGVNDFSLRIRKYIPFEIITTPDLKKNRNLPVKEQKIKEGKFILQVITGDDYMIALDEKGTEFSTQQFADHLSKIFQLSKKRIVFAVGGPWGFSDDVYSRADTTMALSRLTFSHQLVRLLFAEQLYRALTVIKGDPYHHN